MQLSTRHLLGIKNLTKDDISLILSTAEQFKEVLQRPVKKVPSLRDVTIVNLFYENSTRTRFSFELAEKRLSADTINFAASSSSAAKGETLLDTVNNILSMKVDMVVMRHSASGAPTFYHSIFRLPLLMQATASMNTPHRPCWMPFPSKKRRAAWKVVKWPSSAISCIAGWPRVISIY